ncbi:MAG: RNA polymerase sigma factor [Actinomycetota bacterium]
MDPSAEAIAASIDDPSRFTDVFDRYHGVIWRYIARSWGPDIADDVAGDVFVQAFVGRDRFDASKGNVRAWLYGIATNTMRSAARRAGRAERAHARIADASADLDATVLIDEADELEQHIAEVRRAIYLLDERDFEVLVLIAWEGLSYIDAATALGVPLGTVRSRLSRARTRLRALVDADRARRHETEAQP